MNPNMPEREVIVSSLLYLLTRYAQCGEKTIAKAICDHLEMLHKHPETSEGCLVNTCEKLYRNWQKVMDTNASSDMRKAAEPSATDHLFH